MRSLAVQKTKHGVEVEAGGRSFSFKRGGTEETNQADVFQIVGRPVCEAVMAGYNGTIFAYGQTGAGKTFTLLGPPDAAPSDSDLRGLTPRVLEHLFASMKPSRDSFYRCSCSYLQIYKDHITDLLVERNSQTSLRIRESPENGTYVEGAHEVQLRTVDEGLRVLARGAKRRACATTLMNATSSRSHAVVLVRVHHVQHGASDMDTERVRTSTVSLVDLAGSERQQSAETPVDFASNERVAAQFVEKIQRRLAAKTRSTPSSRG